MPRLRPLLWWTSRSSDVLARTGQVGVHSRTTTSTATDQAGVSRTLVPHQAPWSAVDLDGDTVRESVALALRSGGGEKVVFPWLAHPQAITIYARFVERSAFATANALLQVGLSGSGARLALSRAASAKHVLLHHNGTTSTTATVPTNPTLNGLHELRAVLRASGQIQLYQSINGGAESTSGASAGSPALAAAWGQTTLTLNIADAGTHGGADWLTLVVLPAEIPITDCRVFR